MKEKHNYLLQISLIIPFLFLISGYFPILKVKILGNPETVTVIKKEKLEKTCRTCLQYKIYFQKNSTNSEIKDMWVSSRIFKSATIGQTLEVHQPSSDEDPVVAKGFLTTEREEVFCFMIVILPFIFLLRSFVERLSPSSKKSFSSLFKK